MSGTEGLRGLAALSVFINHLLNLFPALYPYTQPGLLQGLLVRSPLHLLWDGHGAVVLFFVLSGFVLTLPFVGQHPPTYAAFLVRRVSRIWLPYAFALTCSAALYFLLPRADLSSLSTAARAGWPAGGTLHHYLEALPLVNSFSFWQFNGVFWSLVYEMRVSLIFPLLIVLFRSSRFAPWPGIALMLLIAALAGPQTTQADLTLAGTARYLVAFTAGITLASTWPSIQEWMQSRRPPILWVLLSVTLLTYSLPWLLLNSDPLAWSTDWLQTIGAAGMIALAFGKSVWHNLLDSRPARYLGRISYSLYLIHTPIILAALHLGYGTLPMWSLLVIIIALVWLASHLMHRHIEIPAQNLGKHLSGTPAIRLFTPTWLHMPRPIRKGN